MLRANSPLLASASSASIVASPFATTVERVMSPEVAGEAGEWEPEGAVAQLAKRMSMELASEAATKQRTKPPLRGAKSGPRPLSYHLSHPLSHPFSPPYITVDPSSVDLSP